MSSEPDRRSRWLVFPRRPLTLHGDLVGGFTSALVMLAIEGSYGLVALAPLGPHWAAFAFLAGIHAAVVGNAVTLLAGGRGPLLGGSSAALALLAPPLLVHLLADGRLRASGGAPDVPLLLALLALAVLMAGVLQLAIGALRLGSLARYVPYPVHAGFMNGVAVLMVLAMSPYLLGLAPGAHHPAWSQSRPLALLVATVTLLLALRPPRWTRAVPSYLTALLAGTALHHLLVAVAGPDQLGAQLRTLEFAWPSIGVLAPLPAALANGALRDALPQLLQFAAAAALISSVQTLLAGSVVDGDTRRRRDGERELFAQGLANIACGAVGALVGAGAVSRSKLNLKAGGRSAASRLVFSLCLLGALALGSPVMRHVPMAAIAGVFVSVAFSLVDPWSRRATGVVLRHGLQGRLPARPLLNSYGVMLLVAATSVFVSLPLGVGLGTLVAMLMFIRSNSRGPVRQVSHADVRASLKMRPAATAALLRAHGRRIALVDLDGPLFFGTADAAAREIETLMRESDQIVIDFRRVAEVDASGARVLLLAADAVAREGKRLLFASLSPQDPRTRTIREMDLHQQLDDASFFPDADQAMEDAEDRLLAQIHPTQATPGPLPLQETLLGGGLTADEIRTLSAQLVLRRVAKGQAVFRRGDAGPSLFVSVLGEIGIWLPDEGTPRGPGRRLVSFAPGVVFGEIGLLEDRARSADAIAEEDAVLYELSKPGFEHLAREQPVLVGKLLRNLSLHLSARVRALTDELKASQALR